MSTNTQPKTGSAWWQTAMLGLAGATLLAACGVTSTSAPASPAGSPSVPTSMATTPNAQALCAQVVPIRVALSQIGHIKIQHASASQIESEVSAIQAKAAALSGQAGTMSSQAKRLTTGLKQAGNAAQAARANPSPMNVKKLRATVTAVKVEVQSAIAEIDAICPH